MRELTTRHGSLLIFDEVMTGFRVALGGAQQRFGIQPDLTTLGKIIGGGLPMAAYGGRADIMKKIAPLGPVYQAGTLSGNPLAVAAGLAMLRYLIAHPEVYDTLEARAAQLTAWTPPGVTVNRVGSMFTFFFSPDAGDGLGIGQEVRHGPVRKVLPLPAGARRVYRAFAIRGGICVGGAQRRGYSGDRRSDARVLRIGTLRL